MTTKRAGKGQVKSRTSTARVRCEHARGIRDVSPNNPCPFLRALVALEYLPDDVAPVREVADTVVRVARSGDGEPRLPWTFLYAVALVANGVGPLQVAHNQVAGVRLNALRGGPFDKQGSGSRILTPRGSVDFRELERLARFATDKTQANGRRELGMDLGELRRMMQANFERAAGRRRLVDRLFMKNEWEGLLQVMGKDALAGRYLSVREVRELFVKRRLPRRMLERLNGLPTIAPSRAKRSPARPRQGGSTARDSLDPGAPRAGPGGVTSISATAGRSLQ
jgi:hypothetical protein